MAANFPSQYFSENISRPQLGGYDCLTKEGYLGLAGAFEQRITVSIY
jgi:hypothetical protein